MATVPVEITWVTSQVVTAAQLNSNLRDAVNFLINRPICQVRQTVSQSFTSGTPAVVTFDSEDVDTDNMHSTVTNTSRITAVTAGRYALGGGHGWATNTVGARSCDWQINGSPTNGGSATVAPVTGFTTRPAAKAISVFLNVGDFLEMIAFQNGANPLGSAVSGGEQPLALAWWAGTT